VRTAAAVLVPAATTTTSTSAAAAAAAPRATSARPAYRPQRRHQNEDKYARFYRMERIVKRTALRRLARKGGVQRLDMLHFANIRSYISSLNKEVARYCMVITQSARRSIITPCDVVEAIKHAECAMGSSMNQHHDSWSAMRERNPGMASRQTQDRAQRAMHRRRTVVMATA
jgi:histone H3/H4